MEPSRGGHREVQEVGVMGRKKTGEKNLVDKRNADSEKESEEEKGGRERTPS